MSTTTKTRTTSAIRKATDAADPTTGAVSTVPVSATKLPTEALVPDRKYFDSYISRQLVKGMTDQDVFAYADRKNDNVLIYGPTGPGKTSATMAYAAQTGKAFYAIPSNIGIDPAQLFGKFVPSTDGGIEWVDGPVTTLFRHGGVLLINEVNFMPERVATVLFSALDKRREITLLDHKSEVIKAHPDLLIVADMNPDYEGTRPLNKAFRNRFSVQLSWGYDAAVEAKLISSKALLNMATKLRDEATRSGMETPISTNMLMEFETHCADASFEFAVMNFLNHFDTDERDAVAQVLKTFDANLRNELSQAERKAREEEEKKRKAFEDKRRKELEQITDKLRHQKIEWAVHPDDPDQKRFLTIIDNGPITLTGDPDEDNPWGVYGVSWNWGGTDEDINVTDYGFDPSK